MSKSAIGDGEDELGLVLGEEGRDYVDVTDEVIEYEKGKVFSCECDQDFGVDFEVSMVNCPSCGKTVVDRNWESRSPPERERNQPAITEWT